jgi:hypothetical protein
MRDDGLARELDTSRWGAAIAQLPAAELRRRGEPPVSGQRVASAFGWLAHYVTTDVLTWYVERGAIGGEAGCWLTPTGYAACMAPYDLGLRSPRTFCLLVDVRTVPELWGPAAAAPSDLFPAAWQGWGLEFYSPTSISMGLVQRVLDVYPYGDTHQ